MAAVCLLVAGCSSNPDKGDRPENPFKTAIDGPGGTKSPLSDRELRQQASQLYSHAREALNNADYAVANTRYDALIARYPFSDYSTQAELDKIYAQYKSYQFDESIAAADRFLRAHPRHPHADYVTYLKGVADFNRDQGLLDTVLPEGSKRDIGNQRRAFEDFALLLQRHPNSRYAGDARRRMLYSRNRIAEHELSVAQFYVSRGAYVAAAKRATDIITEYPGAPATAEALKILQRSYTRIGLEQEAKDTATMIAMNSDTVHYTDAPKPGVVVASAPAAAPAATESATAAAVPAASTGLMSKFAGLFGVFDTSKPEHQHTYVIGGDSGAPTPPAGTGVAADGKTAAGSTAAQTPAAESGKNSGFSVSVEYPPAATDSAVSAAATSGAAAATATTDAHAADSGKSSGNAQPASRAQAETQGFFTWFAGLFSFLDFSKQQPAAPAQPPGDVKTGASSNSDTTK